MRWVTNFATHCFSAIIIIYNVWPVPSDHSNNNITYNYYNNYYIFRYNSKWSPTHDHG